MTYESILQRKGVRDAIISCTRCNLSQVANAPVPFSSPVSPNLVVVGEAPGAQENKAGQPFVGPSGALVKDWLRLAGIEDVAFLNAVCCFPSRTPTAKEVEACRPNLIAQLALLQPTYLLALGGVALNALLAPVQIRIGEGRGLGFRLRGFGCDPYCVATWHPSAVLRNGGLQRQAIEDVTFLKLCMDDEVRPSNQFCYMGCYEVDGDHQGMLYCNRHKPTGLPTKEASSERVRARRTPSSPRGLPKPVRVKGQQPLI